MSQQTKQTNILYSLTSKPITFLVIIFISIENKFSVHFLIKTIYRLSCYLFIEQFITYSIQFVNCVYYPVTHDAHTVTINTFTIVSIMINTIITKTGYN